MFRLNNANNQTKLPHIVHLVTWFPTHENHVEGIFIWRHIQVLSRDANTRHFVVRKYDKEVSAWEFLKCFLGIFPYYEYNGLKVITIPTRCKLFRRFFWRYKNWLYKQLLLVLIKKTNPSLLHLHVVYGFAEEALFLQRKYGLHIVISEHMGPFPFDWLWNKELLVLKPMRAAAHVIAVSEAQAKQIEQYTGIQPEVISNVIDAECFNYRPLLLSKKNYDIILVGIYDNHKGADYLLSIWADFLQVYPNSRLHLVGEATEERMNELRKLIIEEKIENQVLFHGKMTPYELASLYRTCDFYVCASQWESFGVSVLEALFTGLPVLSTDCGGVRSFISDSNGIIIQNDRKKETLFNGMLLMISSLNKFNRKAIAKDVAYRFSTENIKHAYYNIYRKLLPGL